MELLWLQAALLVPVHILRLLSGQLCFQSSSPFVSACLSRWTPLQSRREGTRTQLWPQGFLPIFPVPTYSSQKPTDSSQNLERLPGEGASPSQQKEQALNRPFLQGFPSILPRHHCPPHAALSWPFPLVLPLLFPPFTGLPPPLLPSPPAAWHTALSTCCLYASLPCASGDDTDFVPVPRPAFVRGKKAVKPCKLARRLYQHRNGRFWAQPSAGLGSELWSQGWGHLSSVGGHLPCSSPREPEHLPFLR